MLFFTFAQLRPVFAIAKFEISLVIFDVHRLAISQIKDLDISLRPQIIVFKPRAMMSRSSVVFFLIRLYYTNAK